MRLLVAAGGTAGGIFPAVAVAGAVRRLKPAADILFVGTPAGMEAALVPEAGFPLELIRVGGLKGKSGPARLKAMALLPQAFFASWKILSRFRPTAVFGSGGYATGPIVLTAALRRFRTSILEPNAVPGFANRVLARFVARIFLAFDGARAVLPPAKCSFTGNPIREEILGVAPPSCERGVRTVLVFGGSQGARRLNDAVTSALPALKPFRERLFFIHQTGSADEISVRRAYEERGFRAEVHAFIRDMAGAFRRADLVIARSGSSVLEVAATGRPSILVPYPFAADDHQRANARVFEERGASVILEDDRCDGPAITKLLTELMEDCGRLKDMAQGALSLRRADAAQAIASELARLSEEGERA